MIVGVSPAGGELPKTWLKEIKYAIKNGCNIISGLHTYLNNNKELKNLSKENDVGLIDLRKPPSFEDLRIADGKTDELDVDVVLSLGTDCSVGKMTTTYHLYKKARERGLDAAWIATGQTGLLCGAQKGVVVDRVPSDFVSGAIEQMIYELKDREIIFVEGQGSIYHRTYSGVTLSILHSSDPDAVVLSHDPSRETRSHFPKFKLPSLKEEIRGIEELSETKVVSINAWDNVDEIEEKTGVLTTNLAENSVNKLFNPIKEIIGN